MAPRKREKLTAKEHRRRGPDEPGPGTKFAEALWSPPPGDGVTCYSTNLVGPWKLGGTRPPGHAGAKRMTLTALFDGTVLRPETPLDLAPNTRVRLTLEPSSAKPVPVASSFLRTARALDLDGPPDWSAMRCLIQ